MAVKGRTKYATERVRAFGGKVYERAFHFPLKSQADKYAESFRRQGYSVRIVKHVGVYTVYKRKRR